MGASGAGNRNVISGNIGRGVNLSINAENTVLRNNFIGTNAAGTGAVPNTMDGIYSDSDGTIIGGTSAGQGNLVSGNGGDGIRLEQEGQLVYGNLIGTTSSGAGAVGNAGDGIDTGSGTTGSQIGGMSAGAGNTIANNGGNGVVLRRHTGTNGAILGNSIYNNGALGINLQPFGEPDDTVTLNDSDDSDSAPPNLLINYPVIDSAEELYGTITVDFTVPVNRDVTGIDAWYRIEFFSNAVGADPSGYGEGQTFMASTVIFEPAGSSPTPTGSVSFSGNAGDIITATTSHCITPTCTSFDRTSEFSLAETVIPSNYPPILDPIGPQSGDEGSTVSFDANATDPDADGISFSLGGSPPAGASIDPSTGVFSWATDESDGPGVYDVTVVVFDDGVPVLSDSEVVEITVVEVNVAPALDPVGDMGAVEHVPLSFTASASDPDIPANALSFSLSGGVPGGAVISGSGDFGWTPDESQGGGSYTFDVVVSDDGVPVESDFEQITVTVDETNEAPVLGSVGDQSVDENSLLLFSASATDSDLPLNTLTFSLEGPGVPAGASISPSGSFSWMPGEADGPGVYTFDVVVTDDGSPAAEDRETITVTVFEVNSAPVLGFIGGQNVPEATQLSFVASASDYDLPVNTLVYTLEGAVPSGATITPSGGLFTWTPTESDGPGIFTFDVVVTDDGSPVAEDRETITVTVSEVNTAPVLAPIPSQTVDEETLLNFTANAPDSDLPANSISYSLVGAPVGASIDPTSGLFSWTPGESQGPGIYMVDVVATDDGSPTMSDTQTVTITVFEVNRAPVVLPIGSKTVPEQTTLSFTVAATDPDDPANNLAFSLLGAPSGASINSATGQFTWTPTETQGPGTYVFSVLVTDDGSPIRQSSRPVSVSVTEVNMAPVLSFPGSQIGNESDIVSLTIAVNDPDVPVNTLTFAASGLPDGLIMVPASGEISGKLARPAHITTIFPVTVSVSDGVGGTDVIEFDWTVIPTNLQPTAVDDNYSVDEGDVLFVPAPGLLANDSDPEPQTLISGLVTAPKFGTVLMSPNGSFIYTHTGLTDADDSFIYRVSDGHGGIDTAVAFIEVVRVNEPPIAKSDDVSLDEDTTILFDPLLNDSDPDGVSLTIADLDQPAGGVIRVESGRIRFIPHPNFNGLTTAGYTAVDEGGAKASAAIHINVKPVNDAPQGTPDSVVLNSYLKVTVPVLSNDTDPDGDPLAVLAVAGLGVGEATVEGAEVGFKPPSGWIGTTVLTYTVVDPSGASDEVELTITVEEHVRIVARSLIGDLASGSTDLAGLSPGWVADTVSLSPVESMSLMVNAFYQSIGAFRLPFVFLALSMLMLVGLGGATKVPLLWAGRVRTHWSVVLLDREDALRVFEEPDPTSPVIYNFNPTTESVLSTGRPKVVGEIEWMPVHTPRGEGWVDAFHLTEQVDVEEFIRDARAPRLAREFAERLRNGTDVTSLISDRGIVLALTGPPTRLAQNQFRALLEGARLRRLPTVGGVLQAQEDFRIAVAEPFLNAFDSTGEITASVAHSQTALIPADVWNFRYLALGEGTSQPWLLFFEYENGVPKIVGLGIDE
ncbi:MAG: Ig-like domain-containing protein, partial [Acidimicrobiia bacterium]